MERDMVLVIVTKIAITYFACICFGVLVIGGDLCGAADFHLLLCRCLQIICPTLMQYRSIFGEFWHPVVQRTSGVTGSDAIDWAFIYRDPFRARGVCTSCIYMQSCILFSANLVCSRSIPLRCCYHPHCDTCIPGRYVASHFAATRCDSSEHHKYHFPKWHVRDYT